MRLLHRCCFCLLKTYILTHPKYLYGTLMLFEQGSENSWWFLTETVSITVTPKTLGCVLWSGSALFVSIAQKLFFNTFKIFVRNANVIWPMQWEWLKAFCRASVHRSYSKEVIPTLQLLPVCCCQVQLLKHGLNARFLFCQCCDVDFSERCKVKRAILV